jgi:hypothetical protein
MTCCISKKGQDKNVRVGRWLAVWLARKRGQPSDLLQAEKSLATGATSKAGASLDEPLLEERGEGDGEAVHGKAHHVKVAATHVSKRQLTAATHEELSTQPICT